MSRAIGRFNRWFAPAAAANSVVESEGMGGTHADPLGLSLFRGEIERERGEGESAK
jgi:hypothetical protein